MNLLIILSVIWLISEIVLARRFRAERSGSALDKWSLQIIRVTITIAVPVGIGLSGMAFAAIHLDSLILYHTSLALIAAGLIIRWWAILTLKKAFTVDVSIAADQQLVQSGLYRTIRHPAYLGSLISFLSLGLVFYNWLTLITLFLPILSAFLYRIKVEEEALCAAWPEYQEYMRRTWRLLPWVY